MDRLDLDRIDLVSRLVPAPQNTVVVEVGNELLLVDVARSPKETDTVLLPDHSIRRYANSHEKYLGVVYCSIRFLSVIYCASALLA